MSSLLKLGCLLLTVAMLSGGVYGSDMSAPVAVPGAGTELSTPADTASIGVSKSSNNEHYAQAVYAYDLCVQNLKEYQSTPGGRAYYNHLAWAYYYYAVANYHYSLYLDNDSDLAMFYQSYYYAYAIYYYDLYLDAGNGNAANADFYSNMWTAYGHYASYIYRYYMNKGDRNSAHYWKNYYENIAQYYYTQALWWWNQ